MQAIFNYLGAFHKNFYSVNMLPSNGFIGFWCQHQEKKECLMTSVSNVSMT